MSAERRQFPRFPCKFPVVADGPRGPVRGTCTNLSQGGLFVEGLSLSMGAVVALTVTFPKGVARLEAVVRRVTDAPKGVGLQFMRVEPQHLQLLEQYTQAD